MGLYLLVTPSGSKLWRMNYRFEGRQKTLALGSYPVVTLQEARKRALEAKRLLSQGLDPAKHLKRKANENEGIMFKEVAEEWFEKQAEVWDEEYTKTVKLRLKNWIYPFLGEKPITEIKAKDVLEVLDLLVKNRKFGTAEKVKLIIGQIFRYAILRELVGYDPTQTLRGYLKYKENHYPAATTKEAFSRVIKAVWSYPHHLIVQNVLKFLALTFQRPGEVVSARWEDIDFEKKEWRFKLSKVEREHVVPLSRQALEVLELEKKFARAWDSPWVFPSPQEPKKHVRVETLNAALKRMGINTRTEHTAHGFRASARTILHEVLGYQPDIIEHQLGHRVPDRLGEAYNRTKFIEERRKMMQDWADFIERLITSCERVS